MNKFVFKNILISAVVALSWARPRDKRDVRLADVEDSVNDFKELFTNFGPDSPEARATFDVHSSGDNFISICWNERTVIQLYKNGDHNGYVDYSISLQLAPPEDVLPSSDDSSTEMYEVNDIYTQNKRVLHFVTVKKTDDVTIKENRTSNCRLGQMYSRTFIQLASKKRVEIKLRSQLYKQDFQALALTPMRMASSGFEGSQVVINQRKMVSSEESADQEGTAVESRINQSTEDSSLSLEQTDSDSAGSRVLNSGTPAPALETDAKVKTVMIDQGLDSAVSRKIGSKEEPGDGTTTTSEISSSIVQAARMATSEESAATKIQGLGTNDEIITATERMGGNNGEGMVSTGDYFRSLDSQTGGTGETSSISKEGGATGGSGETVAVTKTITGDNLRSLDPQTGGSGEIIFVKKTEPTDAQTGDTTMTITKTKFSPIILPDTNDVMNVHTLTMGNGDTASMRSTEDASIITGDATGGSGESMIVKKEGVVPVETDSIQSLPPQRGGSVVTTIIRKEGVVPFSGEVTSMRKEDEAPGGSQESTIIRKVGVPVTNDNLRSLDSQTRGIVETTIIKKEGMVPTSGDMLRSLDPQAGETIETTIIRKGGVVPVTGDNVQSLNSQRGGIIETTIIRKQGVVPIAGDNGKSLSSPAGGNVETTIIRKEGVAPIASDFGSLDPQTASATGGSEESTSIRRGGSVPVHSEETEIVTNDGRPSVTGDYLHSLEITTPGIGGGTGMRMEGEVPLETQTEGGGESTSARRGGVPITGSLETQTKASEEVSSPGSGVVQVGTTDNKGSGETTSMRTEGGTPINPVMTCDENDKLKVKVRFGIVDPAGGAKNVEKHVELDLRKYHQGNKGDNFEDALHSLVRSYYGETLNKYIDECMAAKQKAPPQGMKNRALQDDFYVDPQNAYVNPYENLQNSYQYQYPLGGKLNRFETQPHSGSFYLGTDGRYYVVHNPPEPASESLLTKIARTLKSAFASI